MGRKRHPQEERDALEQALAGVKPLRPGTARRMPRPPPEDPPRGLRASVSGSPTVRLRVEREANGIITGRRPSTHRSILDQLEDPRLEVDAECDLHGRTAREAARDVSRFVADSQAAGERWVRIIVGKGLHSPGGRATLKDHVVRQLSEGSPARLVLAFRTAPQRLGGTGALIVRLVDRAAR